MDLPRKRQRADDPDLEPFLAEIGERVRRARALRGMTRRILARDSGVSERYLANLEGGTGNPSVAVLRQLAQAMDFPLHDLLPGGDGLPAPVASVISRLRELGPERMAEVEALLSESFADADRPDRARRIALIGLRGAGKSTLGPLLAKRLAVPFLELNKLIEDDYGADIGELLALSGQPGLRRLERRALERVVAGHDEAVIATGGGVVADPGTFGLLLHHCHCIWLQASPDDHMNRVLAQGDTRPMARNREAMKDLKAILAARAPLYRRAEASIDTSGQSLDATIDALQTASRRLIG